MTEEKVREVALKLNPSVILRFGPDLENPTDEQDQSLSFDATGSLAQVVAVMGWDGAMRLPDVLAFMGRLAIVMEELTNG